MHYEAHLASGATFASAMSCGLVRAERGCPRQSQHIVIKSARRFAPVSELALPSAGSSGQQQAYNRTQRASSEPIGMPHWPILARTPPKRILSGLTLYSGVGVGALKREYR